MDRISDHSYQVGEDKALRSHMTHMVLQVSTGYVATEPLQPRPVFGLDTRGRMQRKAPSGKTQRSAAQACAGIG